MQAVQAIDDSNVRLSVNLNKVALLRNSRSSGLPDPSAFVSVVHEAGGRGITVHPRPDERHIRAADIPGLAKAMAPWRPAFEFNIEGFPDDRLLALVESVGAEQCTLVPDDPEQATSDHGWPLEDAIKARMLHAAIVRVRRAGCRAIVFVDPEPAAAAFAADSGADGIEIFTGPYGAAFQARGAAEALDAIRKTGAKAVELGLTVNVGHDLDLRNLPPVVAALPMLREASIGHALTGDALLVGFDAAIRAYRKALERPAQ